MSPPLEVEELRSDLAREQELRKTAETLVAVLHGTDNDMDDEEESSARIGIAGIMVKMEDALNQARLVFSGSVYRIQFIYKFQNTVGGVNTEF